MKILVLNGSPHPQGSTKECVIDRFYSAAYLRGPKNLKKVAMILRLRTELDRGERVGAGLQLVPLGTSAVGHLQLPFSRLRLLLLCPQNGSDSPQLDTGAAGR